MTGGEQWPAGLGLRIAVVVGWLLTAISYGLAPYCAGGAEWARASCFFLPLWRLFA